MKNDWPRRLTTTSDHDWPWYDSAPFWLTRTRPCATFDIRGHVWVESFHCFALCDMRHEICSLLKRCVCTHLLTHESMIMCSFEHNFPLVHPMWRVSTKLYQLRDVTTCKFSLKRRISALVWLTWTPPCATFDICGHVWAESFHCFAHCERTMRCLHCKTTCLHNFSTYENMHMCNN